MLGKREGGRDGVGSPASVSKTILYEVDGTTHIIQIEIDTAVMSKHKVTDGVRSLNRVLVAIECVQKPWIFLCNEISRLFICPQLSFC